MSQQQLQRPSSSSQQSNASSRASRSGSNSAAIAQLQGKGPSVPAQDLGEMDSGPGFSRFAGGLLNRIAPDEGSSVELKITGKIPLYVNPAISVFFKPTLSMGVSKNGGKLTATMGLEAAVEASGEFLALKAALEGSFKGTLSITGDDGVEIFNEFLLSLRYIVEGACNQANVPDAFKKKFLNAVMTDEVMNDTIEGMDAKDQVKLDLEASITGRASVLGVGGSVGAKATNSTTLRNDGNDNLVSSNQTTTQQEIQMGPFKAIRKQIDGQTYLSIRATHSFALLNSSVQGAAQIEFKNNMIDKVQLSGSTSKELTFDDLCKLMKGANGWLASAKDALGTGMRFLGTELNNPVLTGVGTRLGGTAISPQDANISDMGKEVTKQSSRFDGMAKIKFDATVSWQRGKGFKLKLVIATNNSVSFGMAGNSISLTENDRLMDLTIGNKGLQVNFA